MKTIKTANDRIDNLIKVELSKIIPDNGTGQFLRELIFCNKHYNWKVVAELMQKHFPEKKSNIQRILDYNLSDIEMKEA